jgi:hypothetical protein
MTPDGISAKDWDNVKARAAKIATAICSEKNAQAKKETKALLVLLDKLQKRYGELASILATRADYVSSASESIGLLKKAYAIAEKANDKANLTYITSSLAELYVVDRRDKKNGKLWLAKLRICLKRYFDKHEFNVYKTLQTMIRAPRLPAHS